MKTTGLKMISINLVLNSPKAHFKTKTLYKIHCCFFFLSRISIDKIRRIDKNKYFCFHTLSHVFNDSWFMQRTRDTSYIRYKHLIRVWMYATCRVTWYAIEWAARPPPCRTLHIMLCWYAELLLIRKALWTVGNAPYNMLSNA